jgi:hypothetical protein
MLRIYCLMQVDTGLEASESIQSPEQYWNPNHACVSAYSFGVRSPEGMLTTPSYQRLHWYRENGPVFRQTLLLDRCRKAGAMPTFRSVSLFVFASAASELPMILPEVLGDQLAVTAGEVAG